MRESTYRFGDVEVEAGGREVRRGGTRVALEPKALDVLLLLLADAGRVVEKRRLLREVWTDVHVTDSSLARAVTQVRRALGDDIRTPRYIETVPTRGYRFIGALQPLGAEATTVDRRVPRGLAGGTGQRLGDGTAEAGDQGPGMGLPARGARGRRTSGLAQFGITGRAGRTRRHVPLGDRA